MNWKKITLAAFICLGLGSFFYFDLNRFFDLNFVKSQLDAVQAYKKENFELKAIRGATTCEKNSITSIGIAVIELLNELLKRNQINHDQIISITFSVTKDIDACFPASIARKQMGLENVALLDCQQMFVKNDLKNCIRILAYAWLPSSKAPNRPYLGIASNLRPDR